MTVNLSSLNNFLSLKDVDVKIIDFLRVSFQDFISVFSCPFIEYISKELRVYFFHLFLIALYWLIKIIFNTIANNHKISIHISDISKCNILVASILLSLNEIINFIDDLMIKLKLKNIRFLNIRWIILIEYMTEEDYLELIEMIKLSSMKK